VFFSLSAFIAINMFVFKCTKQKQNKLEACIDDERQFKMAKRSQAPGDATVLKRFSEITSLFFVVDRKE